MPKFRKAQKTRYTSTILDEVFKKTLGHCVFCGVRLSLSAKSGQPDKYPDVFTVEHWVPKRDGGTDDITNLFPSCKKCNGLKACGSIEFLRYNLIRERKNYPKFNINQFSFLEERGHIISKVDKYKFYYELIGLKP